MFDQLWEGSEGDLGGDVESACVQVADSVVLDDVALCLVKVSQR